MRSHGGKTRRPRMPGVIDLVLDAVVIVMLVLLLVGPAWDLGTWWTLAAIAALTANAVRTGVDVRRWIIARAGPSG